MLAERWAGEEAEQRAWIGSLTEADLAAPPTMAARSGTRPLWQYLMHILTHSAQQQADAATLLTLAGRSPGEIDFLNFVADREDDPTT